MSISIANQLNCSLPDSDETEMTRSKVRFRVKREGRAVTEGEGEKKKAVRGRVDRPVMFIGCELAAEFRIEEQHVLPSKIHTLTRLHTGTCIRSQCDGRMTSAATAAGQSALLDIQTCLQPLTDLITSFVNNGDVGVHVCIGNRNSGSFNVCWGDS